MSQEQKEISRWEKLPPPVKNKILLYANHDITSTDRKAAVLVCKQWYQHFRSLDPHFKERREKYIEKIEYQMQTNVPHAQDVFQKYFYIVCILMGFTIGFLIKLNLSENQDLSKKIFYSTMMGVIGVAVAIGISGFVAQFTQSHSSPFRMFYQAKAAKKIALLSKIQAVKDTDLEKGDCDAPTPNERTPLLSS